LELRLWIWQKWFLGEYDWNGVMTGNDG
jgi:hypothetical protein